MKVKAVMAFQTHELKNSFKGKSVAYNTEAHWDHFVFTHSKERIEKSVARFSDFVILLIKTVVKVLC